MTSTPVFLRATFSDAYTKVREGQSVTLPILKRVAKLILAQFGSLSRISAKPAARAKMASATRIRQHPMIVRVALVPLASFFVALGVAAQLSAGLGVGPGDMIVSGISNQFGMSFGVAVLIMSGGLALVATALGKPPRLATLINVALIGFLVDILQPFLVVEGQLGARIMLFAAGLWAVGIGVGCLLHARLGVGTHEAFSLAIADRLGVATKKVRLGQEVSWIVLGLLLGSQAGLGTVAVALFIGPVIATGTRTVGRVLQTLSSVTESPEVAAHVEAVSF